MYANGFLGYWWRFVTDPDFQERQVWMQPVLKFFGLLPPNVWTSMRFPGGIITYWLMYSGYYVSSLVVFLLSVLTDWADGKSARFRGETSANGGILDGIADKFLFLLAASYLIWLFQPQTYSYWKILIPALFLTMTLSEVSRILMPLSKRFDMKTHMHAIIYGKYKFGVQIVLAVVLWFAVFVFPHWPWWPVWVFLLLAAANVLSVFSILFRLYPELEKYAADVVTAGNFCCGILAILFALVGEFKTSVALILIAGILDMADGFVARKTKPAKEKVGLTFGDIADDIGDFVSFALVPAVILYLLNEKIVAAIYLAATIARLIFFTVQGVQGRSVPGVFRGFPSPAAAIFLGSFLLWEHSVGDLVFSIIGMTVAVLEVLFFIRWYHFRMIFQIPDWGKIMAGIVAVFLFFFAGSGEVLTAMLLLYFVFFLYPIANKCWGWSKN